MKAPRKRLFLSASESRERKQKARRNQRKELLARFIAWRKQGCSRCGFPDWRAIDAHHVDESMKEENITTLIRSGLAVRFERELARCIPLCRNCHAIHHFETATWGGKPNNSAGETPMLPGFGA